MKRNYWPVFFIGIFTFTFSMIVWTIVTTSKASLDEDRSFLKKYQEVDETFNEIMASNEEFMKKFQLKLYVNEKEFDLTTQDIKYSQRVLEKISMHKNLLKIGKNNLKIYVINKNTNEKEKIEIALKITKSNSNKNDIFLENKNFENKKNLYSNIFTIKEENNWNITGSFKVHNNIGYIYIKTNAI